MRSSGLVGIFKAPREDGSEFNVGALDLVCKSVVGLSFWVLGVRYRV